MPKKKKITQAPRANDMKMMFVASHGLQTPLSAIRWGSSRLKKTGRDKLSDEQLHLIDGIAENARMLSRMLDAMLILAKVEDKGYRQSLQKIYVGDFFPAFIGQSGLPSDVKVETSSDDDLMINIDRGLFETLIQAVIIAAVTSLGESRKISLSATEEDGMILIACECDMQLSLLSEVRASSQNPSELNQLVGGAPGLMLSIASSLMHYLGGSIELIAINEKRHKILLILPIDPDNK